MEWNPSRLESLRNFHRSSIQLVSMPLKILVISVIYIYIFGLNTLENFLQKQIVLSSVQSLSHVWLFVTHEPQYARPLCSSPTSRVHQNPCPLCWWCHPALSSSDIPFSSCPQSLPVSKYFPMSQLSHQVAKVLEYQLQHQSFHWTPRTDIL